MNNKEFDDIIKEQLTDSRSVNSISRWDDMKAKMDKEFQLNTTKSYHINAESDNIDSRVKEVLSDFKMPFDASHQDAFIQQYSIFNKNRKQTVYKIATRAAAIILLFLSFYNLYDHNINDQGFTDELVVYSQLNLEDYDNNELFVNKSFVTSQSSSHNLVSANVQNEKIDLNKMVRSFNPSFVSDNKDIEVKNIQKGLLIGNTLLPKENIQSLVVENQFVNNVQEEITNDKFFAKNEIQKEKKSKISIGGWASYDLNLNHSTSDKLLENGFSTGLNISKKINKIEVETGLDYGQVHFEPSDNNNYFGSSKKVNTLKVEDVDIVIGSIPLNVKYFIPIDEKTEFYTSVGASLNTILVNNSSTSEYYDINSRSEKSLTGRVAPAVAGVFQGGNLVDNSYVSASIGFGLERELNHNTTAFLEPRFETQINPSTLNLTNDGVHRLNLKLGIKRSI